MIIATEEMIDINPSPAQNTSSLIWMLYVQTYPQMTVTLKRNQNKFPSTGERYLTNNEGPMIYKSFATKVK